MMRYRGDLLEHLRAFTVLARAVERRERGAFIRAAQALALDPSVLRRRMTMLADHVGSPLLEGRGSAARLTRVGVATRERAARALEAVGEIESIAQDDVGPLRIACTGTFLAEVLPPILGSLRHSFPSLRFRVRRAGSSLSRELLEKDEIDFAIVRAETKPGAALKRLGADRLWLAASASTATHRSLKSWAKEPLVGYGGSSATMRRVMDVMGPLGARPWIEVDGKSAALGYVAAGLGIAFVSALDSQTPHHRGVSFTDVTPRFSAVSFWLLGHPASNAFQTRFAELLTARSSRSGT